VNILSDVRQAFQGQITQPEPGTYAGEFTFAADHPIFAGHFPAHPLVPGVYLLQSMWLVLSLGLDSVPRLAGVRTTRFQAQVLPPCGYQAVVKIQTDKNIRLARGEVIFAGQVAAQAVFELAEPV
jgi:3-hydroxyacyl-[acyl-carrier-protein] dehydratase